jgi:dihydroneopterin aldolase
MGTIKLKNIRTYSFHGCLAEEAKIGSDYRVDLEIKSDLRKSSVTDELNDTVDYVLLNKIVIDSIGLKNSFRCV